MPRPNKAPRTALLAWLALLVVTPTAWGYGLQQRYPQRPAHLVYEEASSFAIEGEGSPLTLPCTTDRAGNLWTVVTATDDANQPAAPAQIRQYTPSGRLLKAFGSFGEGPGELKYPDGIAVSPAGHVYIADFRNARVSVFSAFHGTFLRSWELPDGAGPTRIALTVDGGAVYVSSGYAAESIPFRLFKFSLRSTAADGSPELLWSVDATGLNGLTVDGAGNAWAGDWAARAAKQYSAGDGAVLQTVAVSTPSDSDPSITAGPGNLAFNPRTNVLYVLDLFGTVHMFDVGRPTAVPLGTFGGTDAVGGVAIAVNRQGTVFVTETGSSTATLWERALCKERDPGCAECGARHRDVCVRCTDPTWVLDRHSGRCRAPRCTDLDRACARCEWRAPLRCALCKRGWVVDRLTGTCTRRHFGGRYL